MLTVFIALAACLLLLSGCTQPVPPAHLGKVLTPNGYTPDIHPPGRVSGFGPFSRDSLILLETGTKTVTEKINVKLADKADLTFDVRFRTRIAGSDAVINPMFNDIVPTDGKVTLEVVYHTYGKMIVRNVARQVMNDYKVDEVHTNYDRISSELAIALSAKFKNIPLDMSDVALGKIVWPAALTAAIDATLTSRAEVAKIEADKKKEIANAKAREAIALAVYAAEIVEAETLRDYNKTIADGISENFLRFKALQVQSKMIDAMKANPAGNTIYMPYDALGTMGAQMQMFNNNK